MKHDHSGRLLCCLCLLLCLVPLAVFLVSGPARAGANERLSARPKLLRGGVPNADVLSETADYFNDHFGLRQELITANAALRAGLFRESASDDVILGQDGWLFYAGTLDDYQGTAPMSGRAIWCAARNLALMQRAAQAQETDFLFVAAPNNNTICPSQLPTQTEQADGPSNLDRLLGALDAQQVAYCDVRPALLSAAQLCYYRTDSHWNGYGSALAHDAVMQALGRDAALHEEAFTLAPHTGDLYEMLYPAGRRQEEAPALARSRSFTYAGEVRGPDDVRLDTVSETGTGTLFMFRDSFGNALHADLAEDFAAAAFSRQKPYDLSLAADADVLIVELVERNLHELAQQAPVLTAPQPESPPDTPEPSGTLAVSAEESSLPGLTHYQGMFDEVQPDTDSPVYVCLDGTYYEACPTENGFSLHAPAAESVSVWFVCHGRSTLLSAE